jgi:hypothetical protein
MRRQMPVVTIRFGASAADAAPNEEKSSNHPQNISLTFYKAVH